MTNSQSLVPAKEIVAKNKIRHPNESPAYREARNRLLVDEIELRRQIESVAEQRRQLPPGGEVLKEYEFIGENGPVLFRDLFGDHNTLIVYSYMYGPGRDSPCPMCTSFMKTWELKLPDIEQRANYIFVARSPIERLIQSKENFGWHNIRVFSDTDGKYTRDYVSEKDEDMPALNVFTKRDGKIRLFYAEEMFMESADPGQDPRGAPDIDCLWTLLDLTPEGRGKDWYPKLEYQP